MCWLFFLFSILFLREDKFMVGGLERRELLYFGVEESFIAE